MSLVTNFLNRCCGSGQPQNQAPKGNTAKKGGHTFQASGERDLLPVADGTKSSWRKNAMIIGGVVLLALAAAAAVFALHKTVGLGTAGAAIKNFMTNKITVWMGAAIGTSLFAAGSIGGYLIGRLKHAPTSRPPESKPHGDGYEAVEDGEEEDGRYRIDQNHHNSLSNHDKIRSK